MLTTQTAPALQDARAYVNVFFRINTPSYNFSTGFVDDTQRDAFYTEASAILTSLGFDVDPPTRYGACPDGTRGMERLYCHPQDISGLVVADEIDAIKRAIESASTFRLYHIDAYETVYNYTADELRVALDGVHDDITDKIIERFKTKRRNLYLPGYALDAVRTGIPYHREARYNTDAAQLKRIEGEYVSALFDELVEQCKIVTAQKNGTTYYRTRSPRDPNAV